MLFFYVGKRGNVILLLELMIGIKFYFMILRFLDLVKYLFLGLKVWDFLIVYFWGEIFEGVWKFIVKIDNEYII